METLLKTANFLCEGIAFVYLGFNSVKIMSTTSIASDLIVSLFIMFSICLVRWISIGMPAFLFLCYENIKIEVQDIVLIWYSGLIRGAVSVALCFSFDEKSEKLRSIVVLISVFTTLFLATISSDVVRKLKFVEKKGIKDSEEKGTEIHVTDKPKIIENDKYLLFNETSDSVEPKSMSN